MKKIFALIVFGCITGLYSTSMASTPAGEVRSAPTRLNNCATLCPACDAAGGVCIYFPGHCSCW